MTGTRDTWPEALSASTVEAWLATQGSENTRAAYRVDLNVFGRWCAQHQTIPLAVDTAALVAFGTARRAAGDSDATMRRRWSALSSFFRHAIEAGSLSDNPVDGISRPVESDGSLSDTDVLTSDVVDACLDMARLLDPRLDALVSLIVHDGVKVGEALALDTDDIRGRPPRTSVTIRRNGTARRIVLAPDSARAVLRCAGGRRSQPLFTRDDRARAASPRRLSRFGADHLIRQLRNGDDERVTANALRRYHINSSHESGSSIDEVREGAGLTNNRSVVRLLTPVTAKDHRT